MTGHILPHAALPPLRRRLRQWQDGAEDSPRRNATEGIQARGAQRGEISDGATDARVALAESSVQHLT